MKIKIKEGFLLRKVAGDHVVVPVGEAGKVFHGMIRLNDTGAFLWEQCRKETTKEQVLRECETFSVNNVLEGLLW